MSLPTPPKYVVLPEDYLDQTFEMDKPPKNVLISFIRLLSLAWETKYQKTPHLHEEELYDGTNPDGTERRGFLRLSRRQYFEQKADMELLGWLRSSHPRPGFVQFSFSRVIAELADASASAENRTIGAENRTNELRIEEEESLKLIKTKNPPPPSSEERVRKIALVEGPRKTVLDDGNPKTRLLIDNLPLLFDPEIHSVLEWRQEFAVGIPDRVLGWIAKAFQERTRLESPIGLIVKHLLEQDAPHTYYLKNYVKLLPEPFLEAVGEIEYECAWCTERFGTRDLRNTHQIETHPNPCEECHPVRFFASADDLKAHYKETHDPYRVRQPAGQDVIPVPVLDGSIEKTWQGVLHKLQQEMPKASFETWVRDARPVRYDGNVLTVGTRNSYCRDWLANRLTDRINQLLTGLMNKPATVTFDVAE